MLFSSLVFLYIFLPITLLGYYITPRKFKNPFLFLASMVFFAWGGASYSLLLIVSILLNFIFGILIGKNNKKKFWLGVGVFINLLFLIVFKYANFIIDNINEVISWVNISPINNPTILLPIGISFYTFQAVSYLIDVYRKTCDVQRNFINLGLYISLFPQLIAGPIVRYYDIQKQLKGRTHSVAMFSSGIQRFVLGFAKKVLIANTMAYVADEVFALQPNSISTGLAWIGILAYSMQIYYDFAGYSDMAIGLARMFGFELLENFNFPYIAKSIKEFWRRWHISLSNWFRDYLYISLGGNRLGNRRTIINLFIVFFVTGFWHGASWNFLIWGLLHGLFLVLERTKFGEILKRLPSFIQSFYTIFIAVMAWVLFRSETLSYATRFYESLFGLNSASLNYFVFLKVVTRESVFIFLIAVLGALGGVQKSYNWVRGYVQNSNLKIQYSISVIKHLAVIIFLVVVLLYGTGSLVLGAYNPFIYFRF